MSLLIVLAILILVGVFGSVSVAYQAVATATETLETNPDSATSTKRVVTHTEFNEQFTLNNLSTPPVSKVAEFVQTLAEGVATIDLRALTGTNGASVDGNGLRPQVVRVKNLGANDLTIEPGASNGYDLFGASSVIVIPAGAHVQFFTNDGGVNIDATHKTLDLTGTDEQTSEWTIVMG